ncbi:MAG: response regulator [Flavisolibacter sp.]
MTKPATIKNYIIYADDDPDDLALVEQSFEQYTKNVELITFMDGSHAFNFLVNPIEKDFSPCLIILDINMPGLNGKDILKRLRNLDSYSSTPVVLFTTSSLPNDRDFALHYSAGFITKPLDIKQMEGIIDQFIGHCNEDVRKSIRKQIQ